MACSSLPVSPVGLENELRGAEEGRINEFNVEDILSLFLPYHDSPHFAKMVSILHIK